MTTTNQKQEILQSLSSLDSVQSEKVLNYIKGLMKGNQNEVQYQRLKQEAMKEISQALGQGRQSTF
jgi:CO dehydrogenase/acetyl-CoA synthase beta subunit